MMEKKSSNEIGENQEKISLLAVLGSGGHTAEMLKLVGAMNNEKFSPRTFVYAKTDTISPEKLKGLKNNKDFKTFEIPRAREVGQNWLTSFFYTIYAFFCCISLILQGIYNTGRFNSEEKQLPQLTFYKSEKVPFWTLKDLV